jgi:hypothetical protein
MNFLSQLRHRNKLLYLFGWLNFIAAIVCILMILFTDVQVLGINAWIKPMKFYFSIGIFSWTMAWYLIELKKPRAVKAYSVMCVIVFIIEMLIITWQAANGRLSHFNVSSPLYGALFSLMGIAITVLGVWTGIIYYYFFRQKTFDAPTSYIWGIRLGLLLFVIFSFEGGLMASRLSHTIGGNDGEAGLPVVNWSKLYGDLRVAHFFGMHALQILPFLGFYILKTKVQVITASIVYFLLVLALFYQAMRGLPFFS